MAKKDNTMTILAVGLMAGAAYFLTKGSSSGGSDPNAPYPNYPSVQQQPAQTGLPNWAIWANAILSSLGPVLQASEGIIALWQEGGPFHNPSFSNPADAMNEDIFLFGDIVDYDNWT